MWQRPAKLHNHSQINRSPPLPSPAGLLALKPRRQQPRRLKQPLTKSSQYRMPLIETAPLVRVRQRAMMTSGTELPCRTSPKRDLAASQLSHSSSKIAIIPHVASWITGSACL